MKMKLNSLLFSALFVLGLPIFVYAQQGCCSWHGGQNYCDTSVGRWVCNDGAYSPSCGCYRAPSQPMYQLPKPVNPTKASTIQNTNKDNWCNSDLLTIWSGAQNADRFSIAISKYPGQDPGPISDTTESSYTFKNIAPGKWHINIKAGNSERWESGVSSWNVDVEDRKPLLEFSLATEEGQVYLTYVFQCLKSVEGPPELINFLHDNNDPVGKVPLNYTTPQQIIVKGIDYNGKEYSQVVDYIPPEKKVIDNIIPPKINKDLLMIVSVVVVISLGFYAYTKISK